jgi:mono/diheme cytochrome c family protein
MPDMFAGWEEAEKRAAIDAIVALLATQREPLPPLQSTASRPIAVQYWAKGDRLRGSHLYHSVGCVACHAARDPSLAVQRQPALTPEDLEELEELGLTAMSAPVQPVPLPEIAAKYTARSLTRFLLDPLVIRPSGRMPNLKLSPDEAADIAAYLLADADSSGTAIARAEQEALVATGRDLFRQLACARCHAATVDDDSVAPTLDELDHSPRAGCLSDPQRGRPHYGLNQSQRARLRQAIAQPTATDVVDLRMRQLNCYACHQRDDRGGVGPQQREYFQTIGDVDLGDEGRLPPPLTGVGRKLKPTWIEKVLAGSGELRPYLTIRMPIHGAAAAPLAQQFADQDRTATTDTRVVAVESAVDAGRQLMDIGCIQCHPVGGEHLPGVIGVDLGTIGQRINADWFRAFLLDPASLKSGTRMPSFFRNGHSSSHDILAGNVEQQIASLWSYLSESEKYPLPAKVEQFRAHNFELVPTDKPRLLRTFMNQAGPHAIAVGFPAGVHFAFDAERVQVAQFWRGRFLDAHGTWFNRFTPPAEPLGDDIVNLAGPAAGDLSPMSGSHAAADRRFQGYRLDAEGVPTFLYAVGDLQVADTLRPTDQQGFQRSMRFAMLPEHPSPATVWLPALWGEKLSQIAEHHYRNEQGVSVSITAPSQIDLKIDSIPGGEIALIQATANESIEMEYQW